MIQVQWTIRYKQVDGEMIRIVVKDWILIELERRTDLKPPKKNSVKEIFIDNKKHTCYSPFSFVQR